jgi:glutathione synthase/RimK-type ligase-like ATP-grasp enzyme
MKRLIILTDEGMQFLISIPDLKNYISMDCEQVEKYFQDRDYEVTITKFSSLDLSLDYKGVFVLYQTSEAPGNFYKRYIEDVIFLLASRGAVVLPGFELLKAHHDKIFMEMKRSGFNDASLRTIQSHCYGSWVDARNYNGVFPVVVKQSSSSGSAGVFLAENKEKYDDIVRRAGEVIIGSGLRDVLLFKLKRLIKKILKMLDHSKIKQLEYNTAPVSTALVVQPFVKGLHGDYKVLIFGSKYYTLYRENRKNDFRASGSGLFYDVPLDEHEGLLNFAEKLSLEIDFPIIGMDIAFDGKDYHLIEFQVIHLGPPPLQRSKYWHEHRDGKWIRVEGTSCLEEEFSRSVHEFISDRYPEK